jgi:CRISPR/Cas system-associated exonuclease Cas4 (RecB family)
MLNGNPNDWIEEYLEFTSESEAPTTYHKWIAYSIIASAVGRKVSILMGYHHLFPNIYVLLVGPPGRCRKSSALNIGVRFLRRLTIPVSSQSASRAGLIEEIKQAFQNKKDDDGKVIATYCGLTIVTSEFSSLLATEPLEILPFLTDLYDCPEMWVHRTRAKGEEKIEAPYIVLVGGITPRALRRHLPEAALGEGFASRVIFVYESRRRKRNPFPSVESLENRELELVEKLDPLLKLKGRFTLTSEAKEFFEGWYNGQADTPADQRVAGYYERKPSHLLKVAMLRSLAEGTSLVIELRHLVKALEDIEEVEDGMLRLFTGIGANKIAIYLEEISTTIATRGMITYGELLKMYYNHLTEEEVNEILRVLQCTGQISRLPDPSKGTVVLYWNG